MKEANHAFAPPIEGAGTVPREVARYLDGTDQLTKTHGCCCQKIDAAVALINVRSSRGLLLGDSGC
jgi:hypothetical protein